MDPERRDPTHVVARQRISQQLRTWRYEHPGWNVELQIPLEQQNDALTDEWGSLLMTYHFKDDPPDKSWYCRRVLNNALLAWLGGERVSFLAVLHVINNDLLDMQREIGRSRSGASAE